MSDQNKTWREVKYWCEKCDPERKGPGVDANAIEAHVKNVHSIPIWEGRRDLVKFEDGPNQSYRDTKRWTVNTITILEVATGGRGEKPK